MVWAPLAGLREEWRTRKAIKQGDAGYIKQESPYTLDDDYIQEEAWSWFAHRMVFDSPRDAATYAADMGLHEHQGGRIHAYVWDRFRDEVEQGCLHTAGTIWDAFQDDLALDEHEIAAYLQDTLERHLGIDY